jgi:transposase
MRENDWTKVLGWPGYKVYRAEIDEQGKRLKLWVRRKRGNKQLICSGCGQLVSAIAETYEREVRDLPCFEYLTTVVVELYRLRCPRCGVKAEKVLQLPGNAPFSKRFEDAVGEACESAAARRVARQFGLSTSTVLAIAALSGALVSEPQEARVAQHGSGRDSPGQEAEVYHRGKQSGCRRAVVVRTRPEERHPR